uniref:Uncharacterized protein n=1 Tax=Cucumis melo TaxID=3656 RepID=A0A9I9DK60_CUCME
MWVVPLTVLSSLQIIFGLLPLHLIKMQRLRLCHLLRLFIKIWVTIIFLHLLQSIMGFALSQKGNGSSLLRSIVTRLLS